MTEVTLTIHSAGGCRELTMEGNRLLIGRAEGGPGAARARSALLVEDDGLDPRHASINREGASVWVLDEGSAGGTLVNGRRVPTLGAPLSDGDEIFAGHHTTIIVRLRPLSSSRERTPDEHAPRGRHSPPRSRRPSAFVLAAPVLCLVGVAVALIGGRGVSEQSKRVTEGPARNGGARAGATNQPMGGRAGAAESGVGAAPAPAERDANPRATAPGEAALGPVEGRPANGAKLYLQMSQEEQLRFLEDRARHVSMMMGNRPYAFNDEVLIHIKRYVDVYARRVGNNSRRMWGEDLRFVFARARPQYAPHIIRAFNARGVPPVVGLYIAMIETEFRNIQGENFAGAAGLFQFIAPTARLYGVDPSERTNVEKMAPAAAHYMADRIAEFGPDSMSVALAIAGYNRSPDSVRRDLRDVLDSNNKERSFWTLIANSNKLDHYFQNENVKYVPKFFAAAIVGENPEAFGLEMRKLSTYTTPEDVPS
ncbi:MAG TPA: transglycosylase SLT domain-containing protein [Pyrinomonadaceae bacterium]|nr:transglycosylase SLT domain-containing protein [Pyrinomonadaceae bacterium]